MTDRNIVWHQGLVGADERAAQYGHRGAVVWLTGFSGSGKSTVAMALEAHLVRAGAKAYVLDGDNVRHGLNADLGFGPDARAENIRRVGHVAALFANAGVITLASFISPYRADRAAARALVPAGQFYEVHVATDLAVCEARDPKGLYARARAGEIKQFTGLDAPYEAPAEPEVVIDPGEVAVEACVATVVEALRAGGILPAA